MTAIYARQSIERKDSVSIQGQIDQCLRFIRGPYQIYEDIGYSGKSTRRPQFEKLLRDIAEDKIHGVISYRLDRITRNIIDFAELLQLFDRYKVKYISATEQLDTSTPIGRAMVYIVMVFAQLERETIAERVSDNYRFRARGGLFMGGNTPFGYSRIRIASDEKTISALCPNDRADDLRRIFDLFLSGQSLVGIARLLNQAGIHTAKGNPWSANAIRRVLGNISPCTADGAIYAYLTKAGYQIANPPEDFDGSHGMCLFLKNKERHHPVSAAEQMAVVGLHPPIIASEQYIVAQQLLSRNQSKGRKQYSSRTFLAGLLKCKTCGHSVGIKYTQKLVQGTKTEYGYYYCRGRLSRGTCSNAIYIPSDALEASILSLCRDHIASMEIQGTKVVQDTRNDLELSAKLQAQIHRLIDNIGMGNAVVDGLLTQKITNLQAQLDDLVIDTPSGIPAPDIAWMKERFSDFARLDIGEKASCIRQAIKHAHVDDTGSVEVEFAF